MLFFESYLCIIHQWHTEFRRYWFVCISESTFNILPFLSRSHCIQFSRRRVACGHCFFFWYHFIMCMLFSPSPDSGNVTIYDNLLNILDKNKRLATQLFLWAYIFHSVSITTARALKYYIVTNTHTSSPFFQPFITRWSFWELARKQKMYLKTKPPFNTCASAFLVTSWIGFHSLLFRIFCGFKCFFVSIQSSSSDS